MTENKSKAGEEVSTKTMILHGQEVVVRVFSTPDRKRQVSMKTRGKQTNDYSLISGRSEDDLKEIEQTKKKKEKQEKKTEVDGDILGSL